MVAVAFMPRLAKPHPDRRRGATPEIGQASLRDAMSRHRNTFPGVKTPGYQQRSLRDRTAATCKVK
jgi:hypothetical protein